jgi:RND family efflux transporter MFP subunit
MIHLHIKPVSLRAAAAFLTALVFLSCSGSESSGDRNNFGQNATIPAVEAVEARYGSLPLSERLSGTVVANNQVELYPEISGQITEVLVQNGEKVQEGQALARIDDRQYREQLQQAEASLRIEQARLKQAEARLNELEARYRRTKALAERNLSSELEMETLEAQMVSARADVELAKATVDRAQSIVEEQQELLSQTIIRAPITGTVGQRNIEVGMLVSPSTHVYTIGNLDQMRVEVVLTGTMLNYIEVGQTARVYAGGEENEEQVITAKLSRISPFLHNVTRSTVAEIDVVNKDAALKPGMFVPVDILYGESRQTTLIPTSAVYTNPNTGRVGVYVATSLNDEVEPVVQDTSGEPAPLTQPIDVEFKPIEVVARGRMEVGVNGIEPGAWVVTIGQNLLSAGRNQARVRTSSWNRILTLQSLQRQDLLQQILDSQNQSQQPTL